MTNISLRAYHRKIEHLIEDKHIDLALFHCSELLNEFPKNYPTYQLISRSLLDSGNMEAADVCFDILLQINPDEFVAHIGKSIIAENQGELENAISHLKHAFEIQPANEGLQSELKRLLEKKDTVAPNKVILTRGALIKMYMRGKLYEQAIGEIRIGLYESPQRIDYKIALAECLVATDKPIQAVEICVDILKQLPYSLQANEIMHRTVMEKDHARDTDLNLKRLTLLDPYYAYLLPTTQSVLDVPDIAVMVEERIPPEPLLIAVDYVNLLRGQWNKEDQLNQPIENDLEAVIQKFVGPQNESSALSISLPEDLDGGMEPENLDDGNEKQEKPMVEGLSRRSIFISRLKGFKEFIPPEPDTTHLETNEIKVRAIEVEHSDLNTEESMQDQLPGHDREYGFEGEQYEELNVGMVEEASTSAWVSGEELPQPFEPASEPTDRAAPQAQKLNDTQPIRIPALDADAAIQEAEKAIIGGNYNYAQNLFRPLIEKNQFLVEISDYLENAVEQHPEKTHLLLMLGEVYTRLQNNEKALEIFQKAQNQISL